MAGPQGPTSIPFPFRLSLDFYTSLPLIPPSLINQWCHQGQDPDLLASFLAESIEQTSLNLDQAKEECF